jgi:hypothetical protein
MQRMRIGIVGGQKRKTEAHLFKSLDEIGIDVAWHVEAMTNGEFSKDCDAIVSMVDYVGHGLERRGKEFATKNNIPFRQISFNWSRSKTVFLELKEKFDIKNNGGVMGRVKAVPPTPDLLNADDMALRCSVSAGLIRVYGKNEKLKEYKHNDRYGRSLTFYSIRECEEKFKVWRKSGLQLNKEAKEAEDASLKRETVGDVLQKWVDENNPLDKAFDVPKIQTQDRMIQDFHTVPVVPVVPVVPEKSSDYIAAKSNKMYLCRVKNEILYPIISIESLDEVESAVSLDMTEGEKEYIVVTMVKRFKASVKVSITDINEPL